MIKAITEIETNCSGVSHFCNITLKHMPTSQVINNVSSECQGIFNNFVIYHLTMVINSNIFYQIFSY